MIIFKDILSEDELLGDSYEIEEIEDGFFYQVEGKWQVRGEVDVDIGANPSAEGGDDDGGGGSTETKVVDLIDAFRLNEQPSYNKKDLTGYIKPWLARVVAKLPESEAAEFKAKAPGAIKFLLGKVKDLQFFLGESMDPDSTMVYAFYKEGAAQPTFLYPKYALRGVKT